MGLAATKSGRVRLVELARAKPVAPYTLDDQLTCFCPCENLAGLELPTVSSFHRWQLDEHRPDRGEPAVLLLLPCQRVKPYTLSFEHRAVNEALLASGFVPDGRGDSREELAAYAAADQLANTPMRGHGMRIDRAVVSEPFGLLSHEAVYNWRGRRSPAARYDGPGLFEHRGIACTWRPDCESDIGPSGKARWGEAERAAYVAVHNRLVTLLASVLERWAGAYVAMLAYVAPGLTHRSFLGAAAERDAARLPGSRDAGGRRPVLDSVERRLPGAVRLIPNGRELGTLRATHHGRLPSNLLAREECLQLLRRELERVAA